MHFPIAFFFILIFIVHSLWIHFDIIWFYDCSIRLITIADKKSKLNILFAYFIFHDDFEIINRICCYTLILFHGVNRDWINRLELVHATQLLFCTFCFFHKFEGTDLVIGLISFGMWMIRRKTSRWKFRTFFFSLEIFRMKWPDFHYFLTL